MTCVCKAFFTKISGERGDRHNQKQRDSYLNYTSKHYVCYERKVCNETETLGPVQDIQSALKHNSNLAE